jgi:Gluconate 2-dehydrogenase subunit 3
MKTRRAFVSALLGLPLLGGVMMFWHRMPSFWSRRFDEHVGKSVAEIIDLMFPGYGLPGATPLGIPSRIVEMSDFRDLMTAGVAWLDEWAIRQRVSDFLALDEDGKQKALEAAFTSKNDAASRFVYSMRFYAGLMYYSEPTIKAAFAYTRPPQPQGFPDFTNAPQ